MYNAPFSAQTAGEAEVIVSGDWIQNISPDIVEKYSKSIREGTTRISLDAGIVDGIEKKDGAIILHANGVYPDFTLRRVGLMMLAYSIIPGCLIYVGFALYSLMKEIEKCDSPFSDGVVRGMTRFAISLIPYAVLQGTASSLAKQALMTTGSISIGFSLDLKTIFSVLIIIMLIIIFKYGSKLQKESDETL